MIKNKVISFFKENYPNEPIAIFSPGRINLIGEHTDYNEGFVFPAAIDKGIVAVFGRSDTNISSIHALDLKETYSFSIDNIKPLSEGSWPNYILGVIVEIQNKGINIDDFNVVFGGDIPVGAGLSSSAALENSIVFGLNELFQLGLSKMEMITISQKAEHNYVGVKCGIMDQYASMFGRKNMALLLDCRSMEAIPYQVDFSEHQLILINTHVKHSLADSAYNNRREVCEKVASLLKIRALRDATVEDLINIKGNISKEEYNMALYVIEENSRVQKAAKAMMNDDLDALGDLLFKSHEGLQKLYKVSCDELDFLVKKAGESTNVLGARMMGGGFGGCTINIIENNALDLFSKDIFRSYQEMFHKECSIYKVKLSDGTHLIQ